MPIITINQAKKEEIDARAINNLPTEAVLKSPDGTPFKVTVENDGTLATQEVTDA